MTMTEFVVMRLEKAVPLTTIPFAFIAVPKKPSQYSKSAVAMSFALETSITGAEFPWG